MGVRSNGTGANSQRPTDTTGHFETGVFESIGEKTRAGLVQSGMILWLSCTKQRATAIWKESIRRLLVCSPPGGKGAGLWKAVHNISRKLSYMYVRKIACQGKTAKASWMWLGFAVLWVMSAVQGGAASASHGAAVKTRGRKRTYQRQAKKGQERGKEEKPTGRCGER
jgi:hypothetical protein